jgi:hypothetical protein
MTCIGRLVYVVVFMLLGALMPFAVLVASGMALRERGKYLKTVLDRAMSCTIDTQCPPGFICFNGRCVVGD